MTKQTCSVMNTLIITVPYKFYYKTETLNYEKAKNEISAIVALLGLVTFLRIESLPNFKLLKTENCSFRPMTIDL